MATALPITIQMGALPPMVNITPQQLADMMVARMTLQTQQTFSLFVTGSTEPTSNVGPWFKNGTELYVWSDSVGGYVPITIDPASLGYFIGPTAPDQTVYQFWIETTVGGSPLALKIYYSGAWTDVYATEFAAAAAAVAATYAPLASPALTGTPTAPTAAPGTNDTTLASTAFVQAAVGGIPTPTAFAAYPAQGTSAGAQAIPTDGTETVVVIDQAVFNPAPAPLNTGMSRYVAPADGYYQVSATSQFDNDTGTAAAMEINLLLFKNGASAGIGDIDGTPTPNGARWSPAFSGLIQMAAGDYLDLRVTANDGGSNSIDLTTFRFSVNRVQGL